MDYEKEYKEALERAKAGKPMDEVFPELKESVEERIRKNLVEFLDDVWHLGRDANFDKWGKADCADWIAYLEKQKKSDIPCSKYVEEAVDAFEAEYEKQKEHPKEELVYRLNGLMQDYIKEGKDDKEREHRFKCYRLFWDALDDTNFFEQKEQKPNIELIQRSWYMEGYHDREFCREPKWVIKTGEGGPKYEKNEKYGQPLEQKPVKVYDNMDDLIADAMIKEISESDMLDSAKHNRIYWIKKHRQKPAEWSEEDETMLANVLGTYKTLEDMLNLSTGQDRDILESMNFERDWLKDRFKSLRTQPHWKPSEEQMDGLDEAAEKYAHSLGYDEEKDKEEIAGAKEDFIAGAEWQKKQDDELLTIAHFDGVQSGKEDERKEMMKEAVEVVVVDDWQYGKDTDGAKPAIKVRNPDWKIGDRVKLIILRDNGV